MADAASLVSEGKAAYQAGDTERARELFHQAVDVDQFSEEGWLWLSAVIDSIEDRRTCLENVLAINPRNEAARKGLEKLDAELSGASPTPPVAPKAAASSGPFSTSVEWGGLETSSSSSHFTPPEVTSEEYDDWVNNLGIANPAAPVGGLSFPLPSAVIEFTSGDVFEEDEEVYTSGPFDAAAPRSDDLVKTPGEPPAPAAPAKRMSPPSAAPKDDGAELVGALRGSVALYDDEELEEIGGDEDYLQYIPEDIVATRLPGTIERQPMSMMLALAVLVVLNLGGVALLIYQLVLS